MRDRSSRGDITDAGSCAFGSMIGGEACTHGFRRRRAHRGGVRVRDSDQPRGDLCNLATGCRGVEISPRAAQPALGTASAYLEANRIAGPTDKTVASCLRRRRRRCLVGSSHRSLVRPSSVSLGQRPASLNHPHDAVDVHRPDLPMTGRYRQGSIRAIFGRLGERDVRLQLRRRPPQNFEVSTAQARVGGRTFLKCYQGFAQLRRRS